MELIPGTKEWGERSAQESRDIADARFRCTQYAYIKQAADYEVGVLVNGDQRYGTIYSKLLPLECISALQWRQSTRTNTQNLWDQFRIED